MAAFPGVPSVTQIKNMITALRTLLLHRNGGARDTNKFSKIVDPSVGDAGIKSRSDGYAVTGKDTDSHAAMKMASGGSSTAGSGKGMTPNKTADPKAFAHNVSDTYGSLIPNRTKANQYLGITDAVADDGNWATNNWEKKHEVVPMALAKSMAHGMRAHNSQTAPGNIWPDYTESKSAMYVPVQMASDKIDTEFTQRLNTADASEHRYVSNGGTGTCEVACSGVCVQTCVHHCIGCTSCSGNCNLTCDTTCMDSCTGGCYNSCEGLCVSTCRSGCSSTCQGSCNTSSSVGS